MTDVTLCCIAGKLKVESKPQAYRGALETLSRSEIDARLYDRYSVAITEVKVLLTDSSECACTVCIYMYTHMYISMYMYIYIIHDMYIHQHLHVPACNYRYVIHLHYIQLLELHVGVTSY